jgi:hypothetical protein
VTSTCEPRVTISVAGQRDTEAIARLLSARDIGCCRLEVTTRPERGEALSFYRDAGFDERQRRMVKPLADPNPHADL